MEAGGWAAQGGGGCCCKCSGVISEPSESQPKQRYGSQNDCAALSFPSNQGWSGPTVPRPYRAARARVCVGMSAQVCMCVCVLCVRKCLISF